MEEPLIGPEPINQLFSKLKGVLEYLEYFREIQLEYTGNQDDQKSVNKKDTSLLDTHFKLSYKKLSP